MSQILVVQNTPRGGPGRFGDWLEESGMTLDVVHAYRGDPLPDRLDHGALLVLGGGYLPGDDHRAPWLAPTRALTAEALRRDVPFFGICLGGQLLAHVAGGTVQGDHGKPEYGSTALTLRPEAAADALFRALPPTVTSIQRHRDAVTALPPRAHWLVEGDSCPFQAFRVGACAWGVQFHPEAAADQLRHWDAEPLRREGFDLDQICRTAAHDEAEALPVWRAVSHRFASVVRG